MSFIFLFSNVAEEPDIINAPQLVKKTEITYEPETVDVLETAEHAEFIEEWWFLINRSLLKIRFRPVSLAPEG